jgi:putative ABC transport system permease protein
MADSTQTTHFRFWRWLIRFIGVIVPRRFRDRFRQEWEAELEYREALLERWDRLDWRNKLELLWRSLGAFWDALWLQQLRWEDEMIQDLRFGVRMMLKHKGFTAVAAFTLALGIGANTAIFSVVYGVLLRPLSFSEPEQLVVVSQTRSRDRSGQLPKGQGRPSPFSPPNWLDFRAQQTVFADIGASAGTNFVLTDNEPDRVPGANVSAGFFEALRVAPLAGRLFLPADEAFGAPDVVVLGAGIWKRRYGGNAEILGHTVMVNAKPHVVIGIVPEGMRFPDDSELWTPLRFHPEELNQRQSFYLDVIARLKPGVSIGQARTEMEAIAARLGELYPQTNESLSAGVISLREKIVGDVGKLLAPLLGAAAFVLLIACANVANLLLARGSAREKEMSLRAALGASRLRLLRQLMTENALLCLLGASLGVLLAGWAVSALRLTLPAAIPRKDDILLDGRVLLFAAATAVAAAIIFGVAPLLRAVRRDLQASLKESAQSSPGRPQQRLLHAFVVVEVALSIVLLAGAGLMLRTLFGLININPGFNAANVLTAEITLPRVRYGQPQQRASFYDQTLQRLQTLPGVLSVSATNLLPLAGGVRAHGFKIEGPSETSLSGVANFRGISPDYFKTLRMGLLRGRGIEERDGPTAPGVVVINEAMARAFWPNEDPVGKRVSIAAGGEPGWREVVGIVGDIRHRGLHLPTEPEMYVPYAQQPFPSFRLAVRTAGDPMQLSSALRQAVWSVDRELPVTRMQTLENIVARSHSETTFYATLLVSFAGLALILASVGLYGVLSYAVERRTREIGVRIALGAQRKDVLSLVVGQGLKLALLGLALGLVAAWAMTRFVETLLYGVRPTDPVTFVGVSLLLLLVAGLASWLPARRATRLDPITVLRHE